MRGRWKRERQRAEKDRQGELKIDVERKREGKRECVCVCVFNVYLNTGSSCVHNIFFSDSQLEFCFFHLLDVEQRRGNLLKI